MVYLTEKIKKGRSYLYLEHKMRVNGKVKRLWQKYLGPKDRVMKQGIDISLPKLNCETVEFGAVTALLDIARKIGFVEIINRHTSKERDQNLTVGEYLLVATINRCVAPSSKAGLAGWFGKTVLGKFFGVDPAVLNSQTYWNHFHYFDGPVIENIETGLNGRVLDAFDVVLDTVLYDPTNFYTYIDDRGKGTLPQKGHSKEKRNDLNQINLSLFCLRDYGIPLMHVTYPGNENDATHFKSTFPRFIERMERLHREVTGITIVFDKGNHSKEAFKELHGSGAHFVASLRPSTQKDLLHGVPLDEYVTVNLKSTGKEVRHYKTRKKIYGIERDVYAVFDPASYKRTRIFFERRLAKKRAAVSEFFREKLNVKKWRDKAAVEKKIAEVLGKKMHGSVVKVSVTGSYGQLAIELKNDPEEIKNLEKTWGKSFLFTDREDWDGETVIRTYREQNVVEDAFKQLKCPHHISIRPLYHRADECIRVHAFCCILALLLLSLLRMRLIKAGWPVSYRKMLQVLNDIKITELSLPGKRKTFMKLNKLSPEGRKIYKLLGLNRYLKKVVE